MDMKQNHYIFLKGVGCKKGDAVSCPQAPVGKMMHKDMHKSYFNQINTFQHIGIKFK